MNELYETLVDKLQVEPVISYCFANGINIYASVSIAGFWGDRTKFYLIFPDANALLNAKAILTLQKTVTV